MKKLVIEVLLSLKDPYFAVIVIALAALAVAGMAIYGMTLALK